MTAEIFNLNTFFSFFFVVGDYLFLIFGVAIVLGIVASFLEFLLAKE